MKKNFFRTLALSALLVLGVNGAQAQRNYECPDLNPEWKAMADQINSLSMEDPDKANKIFLKMYRKIQKDRDDLIAVGTYFIENKNYPAANMCTKAVYDLDPMNINVLMFCGEVNMNMKRWGEAGQKFDEVLALNPKHLPALKRNAFVYKNVNPHVAIETLNKILELEPTYIKAEKDMGDIYYKLDQYKDAITHYDLYYKGSPKDENLDIRSCENFLQSLYSQADFARIIEITTEVLPLAPKDLIIRRMDFFAKVNKISESLDIDGAVKVASDASAYLSDTEYADSLFLSVDYEYAAALAKEKSDIPAAIEAYQKALAKDSAKLGNYKELSRLYRRNKEGEKCIATYQLYLDKKGEKVDLVDYFGFGNEYAQVARIEKDSVKKAEYIQAGTAVFDKILEKEPGYYKAVMQQAQLNIVDSRVPEETPKMYYEKALTMIPAPNDGKSTPEDVQSGSRYRLTAAQYLAFYYAQKEDFDTCRTYVNIMLEADPESPAAKQFDQILKESGK